MEEGLFHFYSVNKFIKVGLIYFFTLQIDYSLFIFLLCNSIKVCFFIAYSTNLLLCATSGAGNSPPFRSTRVHPGSSGVRVTRSLVLCVVFCRSLFVLFRLTIVLSVPLWFTDFDYPFDIFILVL